MKTRTTLRTTNAPSATGARVHAILAVAGIVTALVCAVILLHDAALPLPNLETSKISLGEVSKLTSFIRVSTTWVP